MIEVVVRVTESDSVMYGECELMMKRVNGEREIFGQFHVRMHCERAGRMRVRRVGVSQKGATAPRAGQDLSDPVEAFGERNQLRSQGAE